MASRISAEDAPHPFTPEPSEPRAGTIFLVMALALLFVFATRWPVARIAPRESDEFGFLSLIQAHWFPMHHTLFLAAGRLMGKLAADPYGGFILLDIVSSALALASVWWLLRALVRPSVAAGATFLLGVGPLFWGYGSVAGNYTAIVLVGAFVLGIAVRGRSAPRAWHPYAAASVMAIGNGYRPDIGVFWLPLFCAILWPHRWRRAILAAVLFAILNLAWFGAMLYDVGGWARYRGVSSEFGYEAGLLNSVWYLGFLDGPVRYAVKIGMAILWTLGPALVFVPRGLSRIWSSRDGRSLTFLIGLSAIPALAFHVLIHFGVAGYSFYYLPSLVALIALGIGRTPPREAGSSPTPSDPIMARGDRAVPRLIGIAALMAGAFWFYPTDVGAPGWRGDFDLAFCRYTRHGLATPVDRAPKYWRTANSRDGQGRRISVLSDRDQLQ